MRPEIEVKTGFRGFSRIVVVFSPFFRVSLSRCLCRSCATIEPSRFQEFFLHSDTVNWLFVVSGPRSTALNGNEELALRTADLIIESRALDYVLFRTMRVNPIISCQIGTKAFSALLASHKGHDARSGFLNNPHTKQLRNEAQLHYIIGASFMLFLFAVQSACLRKHCAIFSFSASLDWFDLVPCRPRQIKSIFCGLPKDLQKRFDVSRKTNMSIARGSQRPKNQQCHG